MSVDPKKRKVEETISAEDQFTDSISPFENQNARNFGFLSLSISDNGDGNTITVQRSFDDGTNWHDVDTFNADVEENIYDTTGGVKYRAGCKTGDFVDGAPTVKLVK